MKKTWIDILKRGVSMILVLIMLAAMAVSCNTTPDAGDESSDSTSESETEPETEAPVVKEPLTLLEGGKFKYKIIRPELAGAELLSKVKTLREQLAAISGSDSPSLSEDWLNPITGQKPDEFEIIIGKTNRDESKKALESLKYNDWTIDIINNKLIILGHTDETTIEAVDYFMKNFVGKAEKGSDELVFDLEDCFTNKKDYPLKDITINNVSISEFKVIYSSVGTSEEKDLAKEIASFLSQKTGYVLDVKRESEENEYEIIIGNCDREASKKLYDTFKYDDYGYRVDGKKLVISSRQVSNIYKAPQKLFDDIERHSVLNDTMSLTDSDYYIYSKEYKAGKITISGTDITEYKIVYPEGDTLCMNVARNIRSIIISAVGEVLTIISDKTPVSDGKEILVGDTNRTAPGGEAESLKNAFEFQANEGVLAASDKYILVCGGKEGGFGKAVSNLINTITPEVKTEVFDAKVPALEKLEAITEDIRVMSFNILTWPDSNRLSQIIKIIKDYSPDVIGMQEVVPSALSGLNSALGNTYAYVNASRDNSTGESTPIWYNKEKYTLIESGTKWLSSTPDVMSKYPESDYTRIYTYVVLESKETGARFVHVNTHIDYVSEATSKQVSKLLELTAGFSYMPMFYTADWNMSPGSKGYSMMQDAGYMDSRNMAAELKDGPTMSAGGTIDFCFTSVLSTSVDYYKVINDHEYSSSASDHYPIVIDMKIIR